jgi:hypothetical protein
MRVPLVFAAICIAATFAPAQSIQRDAEAESVKTAIRQLAAAGGQRVEIVLRDLRRVKGILEEARDDSFAVKMKYKDKPLISIGTTEGDQGRK